MKESTHLNAQVLPGNQMDLIGGVFIPVSKTIRAFSQHKCIEKLELEDTASEASLKQTWSPRAYRLEMGMTGRQRKDRTLCDEGHGPLRQRHWDRILGT